MLQFIAQYTNQKQTMSQINDAIEGGCRWIQLDIGKASSKDASAIAQAALDICKAKECYLIVSDQIALAKDLGLDGVLLSLNSPSNPNEARIALGAKAIIGVTVDSFSEIEKIAHLDIDYICINMDANDTTKCTDILKCCNEAKIRIPIVASGDIACADIEKIMSTGVNGIAVSKAITDAKDPQMATASIIETLTNLLNNRLNNI